ncbi:MAG TPA: (2Fe-2S)-binding protein, partial [Acidimicrobiia bacterium]|nr:(2Fe-2S)-binding protein [Acidimicrobiia bacterium]
DDHVLVIDAEWDCNWVQALEGLVDSAHAGILHADVLARSRPAQVAADGDAITGGLVPRLEVERTDFGLHYAAIRPGVGAGGADQVRVTAYVAPFLCFIAPAGMAFLTVPVDDTHTRFFNVWWSDADRLDAGPAHDAALRIWGVDEATLVATGMVPLMPPPGPIPPRNVFAQDRAGMRAGTTTTGLSGITAEDAACAVVAGPLVDRSKEHLVPSDLAVIRTRRVLLDGAAALAGPGGFGFATAKTAPGDIGAASGDIAAGGDWRGLVPGHVALDGPADPGPESAGP